MKVLEQARPNLPQKPAKSTKQVVKGASRPETFNTDDDDVEPAAVSKPASAAANKAASKAAKPNSAAASAAGKKVQFLYNRAVSSFVVHRHLLCIVYCC